MAASDDMNVRIQRILRRTLALAGISVAVVLTGWLALGLAPTPGAVVTLSAAVLIVLLLEPARVTH